MRLGVVADDFTGATDIAGALAQGGMRVMLTIGAPAQKPPPPREFDAAVVALKSRALPAAAAVSQSRAALKWLQAAGAAQFYFKYCSTFDSTASGNIGPVADALMDDTGAPLTIICPAYPDNARSVYQGNLFVGDQLLSESPMKNHPLNPMRDSNLMRLLAKQSDRSQTLIAWQTVRQGAAAIRRALDKAQRQGAAYAVVDAIEDADLAAIGAAAAHLPLLTGGAGLAQALPAVYAAAKNVTLRPAPAPPQVKGRAVVLCGSCSQTTRRQIARAKRHYPSYQLNIANIAKSKDAAVREVLAWAKTQPRDAPLLIYGSAAAAEVKTAQARLGPAAAGALMESAIGGAARALVRGGARKIVVAGGETSGAVVEALNIRALRISAQIAPGVPWTESITGGNSPHLALALKSGNFGGENFFQDALKLLQ